MSLECRNVTDGAVLATIAEKEVEFINLMVEASKKDRFGLWQLALCKLKKAEDVSSIIFILQSSCDISKHEFINENITPII